MEKKGIFLENRHVSLLLSAIILIGFFVFISGYFFGKKKTVEKFYSKVDQESLADHVYYSVCANYGNCDKDQEQESTEDSSGVLDKDLEAILPDESKQKESELQSKNTQDKKNDSKIIKDNISVNNNISIDDVSVSQESCLNEKTLHANTSYECMSEDEKGAEKNIKSVDAQDSQKDQYKEEYYAELVGFGSKSSANIFCNKLKKRGIEVVLKERRSRTSKGRNVYWYQVVTEKFDNKSDLVAFVDIIKDKENLKGIKIVQC